MLVINIVNCARCGESHKKVEFKELSRDGHGASHWAPCPKNGEPLMLKLGGDHQMAAMRVTHVDLADKLREALGGDLAKLAERVREVLADVEIKG